MTKDQIEAWRGALTGVVHLLNERANGQLPNVDKMDGGINELCALAIKGCALPVVACSGETPRTEAMIESCGDYEKAYHYNGRFADFARQLERELAEMTKFRDEWKSRTWAAEDKLACTPSPQRESTGMVCPEDGNHCCISICLKQGCREQAERREPQRERNE